VDGLGPVRFDPPVMFRAEVNEHPRGVDPMPAGEGVMNLRRDLTAAHVPFEGGTVVEWVVDELAASPGTVPHRDAYPGRDLVTHRTPTPGRPRHPRGGR